MPKSILEFLRSVNNACGANDTAHDKSSSIRVESRAPMILCPNLPVFSFTSLKAPYPCAKERGGRGMCEELCAPYPRAKERDGRGKSRAQMLCSR